jgi:hypothetical protein
VGGVNDRGHTHRRAAGADWARSVKRLWAGAPDMSVIDPIARLGGRPWPRHRPQAIRRSRLWSESSMQDRLVDGAAAMHGRARILRCGRVAYDGARPRTAA